MHNRLSNLSIGLLGFVAGVAFLVSCGGGDSTGVSLPINNANANVPQITDQMICYTEAGINWAIDETYVANPAGLPCMKQSTKVKQVFNNLSEVYAEGWVMVQASGFSASNVGAFLFYK